MKKLLSFFFIFCTLFISCSEDDTSSVNDNQSDSNQDATTQIPFEIYERVYGVTSEIYQDDNWVYINVNSLPDHGSPYYEGTQWEESLYVPYDGSNPFVSNFILNPNRISVQNILFKIPRNPSQSSVSNPTAMGPIGVALNGVPFYNQYGAGGNPLDQEINSFDQYNGHPAPGQSGGRYHYHMEPFWLTENYGKGAFIGFLLDGFPVFGPEENGSILTSSDLDEFHGHFHENQDFPNGIYHYHITADAPYLNGIGYYGFPGIVTQ
tara:strand:- start:1407 stop:2201 length:795 start_codon:yes stop_codon:yes gene_type:complete